MKLDELLDAAEGDRREALRLLFVIARRQADDPDQAVATGSELAELLVALLEDPDTQVGTLAQGRATSFLLADEKAGPTPTAATVAEAIEELLHGTALDLPAPGQRYDHVDLLGGGGMGQVHRVFDQRLRRSVALKAMHAGVTGLASARRFAQEAEIAAQLDHPNIVPVYDIDVNDDGALFFTMKEVRGRSLWEIVDELANAAPDAAESSLVRRVQQLARVCDAVAYAHERRIAHRDIKPDNVMIGDFGAVLVVDWGLAARFGDTVPVAGTPAYLAPEVALEPVERVGPSTDIYALGATLYHLLALRPPYEGDAATVLAAAQRGPPPPPSAAYRIPDELTAVAMRAMARAPEDRYRTVSELADDLQAWLDGRPLASLSYGRAELLGKWMRRNRGVVRAIALTTTLVFALGGAGAVRYVLDVTSARDEARQERDRAVVAETEGRARLAAAQLSAARASTETARFSRADAMYREAADVLQTLGQPALAAEIGLLDNHDRATRPAFTIPLPDAPAELLIEPEHGWLVRLTPADEVVALAPPAFEVSWRSAVPLPDCVVHDLRWEHDTFALYCVRSDRVDRIDLGTGETTEVTALVGQPPALDAPAHTDLLFVGVGDQVDGMRDLGVIWRVLRPGPRGWETLQTLAITDIPSARGPWFIGEHYGFDHGAVLYHADRGRGRTLGLPLARGALSTGGGAIGSYDEGTHVLQLQPLEGGPPTWTSEPKNPLAVRSFAPDDRSLFAAGTTPTILEVSAADGTVTRRYDGHERTVIDIQATSDLVLGRSEEDRTIRGFGRAVPTGEVPGAFFGLLPPGDVLVGSGAEHELVFVDIATRKVLRRVPLDLPDGAGWGAESVQRDGALVVSPDRVLFVPFADEPVQVLAIGDGRPILAGDRLEDGHVALCRGSDVVLIDPQGTEHALGSIERARCRDLELVAPDAVYVSDFWGHAMHRFGLGRTAPWWSQRFDHTVYRLSTAPGLVALGDYFGRVSVFEAESGRRLMAGRVTEGPMLGNALSGDGALLAVGGWDQRVLVLDTASGRVLAEDQRHTAPVEWLAWSDDERRLVSADPGGAVVRDLDRPARLAAAHAVLSDLASEPDRVRDAATWADVARGLAVNGLWRDALRVANRADGLTDLELARWSWLAGDPAAAAEAFARTRRDRPSDPYLTACEAAARSEANAAP